ncbi:intracellular short-chain-length polyhydroxyalkanoate depolymerase [Alkaliphilus transvaalensis]|uniref:intracellular short-chain-length polyhydroxyalkanoate depolymerase n=1 Tax=Alkaliphilus transvaalensis TaxID=114628 RepID=UPI00047B79CA|nr:alpha/beta hydrolase [Alkaliphilus transvaalensis]
MRKQNFATVEVSSGETLFYREIVGGDENILLLHGNMSSSKHWEPIFNLFPEEYSLYAVDLRGMGKSTYYNRFDTLQELAEDIKVFIDRKNLNNLTVVGWSTGGGVAMELAANYPDLVKNLILLDSVSYLGYPIWKKDEQGNPLIGEAYSSKEEMAKDPVQVAPMVMAIENHNRELMKTVWDMSIYVHKKPSEEAYNEFLDATFEQRNLVDIDWALATFDISNKINDITASVLALWGDSDLVVTRDMVEETVKAIGSRGQLEVLPQCGHSPLVDCPELLVEKILAFIG